MPANPTPLPTALQPLNVALAGLADKLDKLVWPVKDLGDQADRSAGLMDRMRRAVGEVSTAALAAGAGLAVLSKGIGLVSSEIASFVAKFDPAAFRRFQLASDDFQASVGRVLVPLLDQATAAIRAVADAFASLTPAGRALVAGSVAAAVGLGVLAASIAVVSAVVNSATFGLSAAAAVLVGVAVAGQGLGPVKEATAAFGRSLTELLNVGGRLAQQFAPVVGSLLGAVLDAVKAVFGQMAGVAQSLLPAVLATAGQVGPLIGTVVAVVGQLAGVLLELYRPIQSVLTLLTGVVATGLRVLIAPLQVLTPVLSLIAKEIGFAVDLLTLPLRAFLKVVSAVADRLAPLFAEIGGAMQAVVDVVGEALGAVSAALGGVAEEAAGALLDLIVPAIERFAEVVSLVARVVRELADDLRLLLGLPEKGRTADDTFKSGASQGLAVRQVSTGSVEDYIRKAQQAAFSVGGRPPEERTATATEKVAASAEQTNALLGVLVNTVPAQIAVQTAQSLSALLQGVLASQLDLARRGVFRGITG